MSQTRGDAKELRPTSAAGYADFLAVMHPSPEAIDDRTFVLGQPLPSAAYVTSTLCYVIVGSDGTGHIVDPGWNTDENMVRLRSALEEWGVKRVGTVVATHLHDDHLGMADRVRSEFGAQLALSRTEWDALLARPFDVHAGARLDAWGVPEDKRPALTGGSSHLHEAPEPDIFVADGDVLDFGRPFRVLLTPGHSQGGITLIDQERGRILTGDHIMPHLHPGLGLGYVGDADPVGDYLESAERLFQWDGFEVLPGHGYRFAQLGRRIEQHIGHHLRRTRQVAQIHAHSPEATIWQTAAQLSWSAGWDALNGYFLFSALAQTAMHLRFVRDTGRSARWLAQETRPPSPDGCLADPAGSLMNSPSKY